MPIPRAPRKPASLNAAAMADSGVNLPAQTAVEEPPLLQPEPAVPQPATRALTKAPAKAPKQAVERHQPAPESRLGFSGEYDTNDFGVPLLKVFHTPREGDVVSAHMGDFIFDNTVNLGKEVDLIFLGYKKWFTEITDSDEDRMGRKFATTQDFRDAGFSPDQVMGTGEATVMFQLESDKAELLDGAFWVMARFYVNSTRHRFLVRNFQKAGLFDAGPELWRTMVRIGTSIKTEGKKSRAIFDKFELFEPFKDGEVPELAAFIKDIENL